MKNKKKIVKTGIVAIALSGTALMAMNPGNPDPTKNSNCNPPESATPCDDCGYNLDCAMQSYCLTAASTWQCDLQAVANDAVCRATCWL